MHTTHLRKVGGSVMMVVPPAICDLLRLRAGAAVGVRIEDGCLVVAPVDRPQYTLGELLAQCDAAAEPSAEDRQWLADQPVGLEIL